MENAFGCFVLAVVVAVILLLVDVDLQLRHLNEVVANIDVNVASLGSHR